MRRAACAWRPLYGRLSYDQLGELGEIDIAAGYDAHDWTFERWVAERRSQRQRARALGNGARFLRDQAHRIGGLLESDGDRAIGDGAHPLPHPLCDALAAGTVDERGFPSSELLRAVFAQRKSVGRRGFGLRAEHLRVGLLGLYRASDPGDEAAAADGAYDSANVRTVFDDLESHRAVARDEVVIVERVDECRVDAGEFVTLRCDPGAVVGDGHNGRAKRAHAVELGLRRGFDRDDRARDAILPSGVGDALTRVAGADRPHAARARLVRQCSDGIGTAADLVGVSRLQVFELQPDVAAITGVDLHQRRPQNGALDALTRRFDVRKRNRPYRRNHPTLSCLPRTSSKA